MIEFILTGLLMGLGNFVVDGQDIRPIIGQAIATHENDRTGKLGVRNIETTNPSAVLRRSVNNNLQRWQAGDTPAPWIQDRPAKFIDFMQKRWAPIGAENDPNNQNQYWAPDIRKLLRQKLGADEYKKWQALDLVKNRLTGTANA